MASPRRPTIQDAEERIRSLHARGLQDEAIAARLGRTKSYVGRVRLRLGLPGHRPQRVFDPERARRMLARNLVDREVAEILGVSRESIQKWRRSQGIPGKPPGGWLRVHRPKRASR